MTVSLCLATRGHADLLQRAVVMAWITSRSDDTRIVIGCDDDDPETIAAARRLERHCVPKVVVSIAAREDALGAKYNRCQQAAASCRTWLGRLGHTPQQPQPSDVYAIGCDDWGMITPGWDLLLEEAAQRRPDGIAMVYFGALPGVFQGGQALTHGLVEKLGYFVPPYFPCWWHDIWLNEVGTMLGRIEQAAANIKMIGPLWSTRGLRDVTYWAGIYDVLALERRASAEAIIADPGFAASAGERATLLQHIPFLALDFHQRGVNTWRDPKTAAHYEATMAYDAPADERYRRVKAAAGERARSLAAHVRASAV